MLHKIDSPCSHRWTNRSRTLHPRGQSNVPFLNNHQDLSIRLGYISTYKHKQNLFHFLFHIISSILFIHISKNKDWQNALCSNGDLYGFSDKDTLYFIQSYTVPCESPEYRTNQKCFLPNFGTYKHKITNICICPKMLFSNSFKKFFKKKGQWSVIHLY